MGSDGCVPGILFCLLAWLFVLARMEVHDEAEEDIPYPDCIFAADIYTPNDLI